MNLSTSAREIRCPQTHPKFNAPCDKLLARYEPGTIGLIELDCRRCGGRVSLQIRSTAPSSTGVTV